MPQKFLFRAATPYPRQIDEPCVSDTDGPPCITECDIVDKDPSMHPPSSYVRDGSPVDSITSQTVSNSARRSRSRMRKESSDNRSREDADSERSAMRENPHLSKMLITMHTGKSDDQETEIYSEHAPREAAKVIAVGKPSELGDSVTKYAGDGGIGIQLHPPRMSKGWNYKFLAKARRRLARKIDHKDGDLEANKNERANDKKPAENNIDKDKMVTETEPNSVTELEDIPKPEATTKPETSFKPRVAFERELAVIKETCTIIPDDGPNKFDELVQLMALVPKPYNENQDRAATRSGYASEKCGYYQDRTDPLARPTVERNALTDSAVALLVRHTEAIPLEQALRRKKFREIIGTKRKWYPRCFLYKQSLKRVKPKKRRNTIIFVKPKDDIYVPEHGYVLTEHGYSGDNSDTDSTRIDFNRKKKDVKDRIYKRYPTVRLPDFLNQPRLNTTSDTFTANQYTLGESSSGTTSTDEISDTSSSEEEKRFITIPGTVQVESGKPTSKNVRIIPLDLINYVASPIIQDKLTLRGKIRKMVSRASKFLNKWSCGCIGKKNKKDDSNNDKADDNSENDMCLVSIDGDTEDDSNHTYSSASCATVC